MTTLLSTNWRGEWRARFLSNVEHTVIRRCLELGFRDPIAMQEHMATAARVALSSVPFDDPDSQDNSTVHLGTAGVIRSILAETGFDFSDQILAESVLVELDRAAPAYFAEMEEDDDDAWPDE